MNQQSGTAASVQPVKAKHSATISGWSEALGLSGVLLVGIIIWLIPPPAGVQLKAWRLLAIFVATIIGIIARPLPMGAIALLGIATTAFSGTLTINQSLSGFGNSTIWLMVEGAGTLVRGRLSRWKTFCRPAVNVHLLTAAPCAEFRSTLLRRWAELTPFHKGSRQSNQISSQLLRYLPVPVHDLQQPNNPASDGSLRRQ
jgi:Sodium:sulfate symporter transmembrane region